MKIAGEIIVSMAGEEICLHPSLRHAMQLAERPGGFQTIARDIIEGSLTVAIDLIAPNCDLSREYLAECVLEAGISTIQPQLLEYIVALVAIDPEEQVATNDKGNKLSQQQPYNEFFLQLYRWGTGWLGWSPEQTLSSTPFEIIEAHKGRMDMLKAIFGGGEGKQPVKDERSLDDKFKAVFSTFGTRKVTRSAE